MVGAVSVRLMAGLLSLVVIVRRIRDAAQGQAWCGDVVRVGERGVDARVLCPSTAEVVAHPTTGALPGLLQAVRAEPGAGQAGQGESADKQRHSTMEPDARPGPRLGPDGWSSARSWMVDTDGCAEAWGGGTRTSCTVVPGATLVPRWGRWLATTYVPGARGSTDR